MPNKKQFIKQIAEEILNQQQHDRVKQIVKAMVSYLHAFEEENITEDLMVDGIKKLAEQLIQIK